jgi:hypothetical protein
MTKQPILSGEKKEFMYKPEKKSIYTTTSTREKYVWVTMWKTNRLLMILEILIYGHSDYKLTESDLKLFRRGLH